ncbi:kinetochore protein Spc25 [Acrasis kona]|uniref:Kinetochore protein SPC25 n=1 Tax=Acrasis kona TaxID=1008807 RepID=A0AAW2YWR4_9EUKA
MSSITQQTCASFDDLSKELDAMTHHLQQWSIQQSEILERGKLGHEAHFAECHQKMEELAAQYKSLLDKRREMEEQLQRDYSEEDRLNQHIKQLQNTENRLPEKLKELKKQLDDKGHSIERERDALQRIKSRRDEQQNREAVELSFYEKQFGLSFEFEQGNWLRCCFVAVSPTSPKSIYSFCVKVDSQKTYTVKECSPDVNYEKVLAEVNKTNDIQKFMISMRALFVKQATE